MPTAEVAFVDEIFKANRYGPININIARPSRSHPTQSASAPCSNAPGILHRRLVVTRPYSFKLCGPATIFTATTTTITSTQRSFYLHFLLFASACFHLHACPPPPLCPPMLLVLCSAILNSLLTLLNERLFDNGNQRLPVPLLCLIGASNELPESEELDALYDRFLIRRTVNQVLRQEPGCWVISIATCAHSPKKMRAQLCTHSCMA